MDIYNHFAYGESIARKLKDIAHSDDHPRFFTAFGLEDLYNFTDKISSVKGIILIAVDGCESDSTDNGHDALTDRLTYSFIVAGSTVNDRPQTLDTTVAKCRSIAKQIRNHLFLQPTLRQVIDRNTQITGIGPIGDNFYGVILTFAIEENEQFFLDQTFWEE